MSLQSRFIGCGEGESRRKDSYGDPLSLVERTADAKLVRDLAKHRRAPMSPSESFLLPSPGRLSTGLKTQRRVLPRPPASGADCLFRQVRREVLSRPLCSREPFTF